MQTLTKAQAQDALRNLNEALDPALDEVWCTVLPYREDEDRYLAPDAYEDERSRRIARRVDAAYTNLREARIELRGILNGEEGE